MRKYINTDYITLASKQQIDIHVQLHLSARLISYAQKCPRTVWNDILKIYNEHTVLSHTMSMVGFSIGSFCFKWFENIMKQFSSLWRSYL